MVQSLRILMENDKFADVDGGVEDNDGMKVTDSELSELISELQTKMMFMKYLIQFQRNIIYHYVQSLQVINGMRILCLTSNLRTRSCI